MTDLPIETVMTAILATGCAVLIGLHFLQLPSSHQIVTIDDATAEEKCRRQQRQEQQPTETMLSTRKNNLLSILAIIPFQLPNPITEPSKYCHEIFTWNYSLIWMSVFGCIVITQMYESFNAWGYFVTCGGLALPLLLQPWVYPRAGSYLHDRRVVIVNPDVHRPFQKRYSTKVAVYLATYSFIGNYWYTHYFYSVLQAKYTMPSHRLNDVPIAMFLATHFYFSTYHACISNGFLRFVDRNYSSGWRRTLLFGYSILFLSYLTAFMETLTISSFPYYSFEDRTVAYIWGSAFYGIYFIISFPGFYYLDTCIDENILRQNHGKEDEQIYSMTLKDVFITACGHGMIILTLLDFVRLYLGMPLIISGVAFASTG